MRDPSGERLPGSWKVAVNGRSGYMHPLAPLDRLKVNTRRSGLGLHECQQVLGVGVHVTVPFVGNVQPGQQHLLGQGAIVVALDLGAVAVRS